MKNLIFALIFTANVVPLLYSMEIENVFLQPDESVNRFSIQSGNYNLLFRAINLHQLIQKDRETLLNEFGDFDAVSNMFGYLVSVPFKVLHFFSPEKILDIYTKEYDKKFAKMPLGKKVKHHWFIEDRKNDFEHVGHLVITTYVEERPEDYADTLLLEIGLFISQKYRNKGITSQLAGLVYKKLKKWEPFKTGVFCISTRADNIGIHRLAEKYKATKILTHERPVDFGLFTLNELCDLFVID